MGWAEGGRAVLGRLRRIKGKLRHPVSTHPTPEGRGHDLENNRNKRKKLLTVHIWGEDAFCQENRVEEEKNGLMVPNT